MARARKVALTLVGCVLAGWCVDHIPLFRRTPHRPTLLAHRGVHPAYDCPGLDYRTGCSATCMRPSNVGLIENTLPSMRAAFAAGADVIELDVHGTVDGELAVFHDWRLECRTDGHGVTHEQTMAYLRTLDVGYGYTADGGKTFPLRGRGVGLLPSLREVLDEFPERRLLIHLKENDPKDGDRLVELLRSRSPAQRRALMVYGGDVGTERALAQIPELRGLTRPRLRACVVRYALWGWTGRVPAACARSLVVLPASYARGLWGWPQRLVDRLHAADAELFLYQIDDPTDVPEGYDGGIWTDTIEALAPARPR